MQKKNKEEMTMREKYMKKKKIPIAILVVVVVIVIVLFGPTIWNKVGRNNVITTARLEKAIDISQLSTAEFVYNGVAEKRKEKDPEEVECYISYNANVKVGIKMEDVKFDIDKEARTVTPILPEITVNIATLDEESISYIPENPDITLKEVIKICKEDVMNEANNSEKLYQTAEDNLKAVIVALLSPILENAQYSIVWK